MKIPDMRWAGRRLLRLVVPVFLLVSCNGAPAASPFQMPSDPAPGPIRATDPSPVDQLVAAMRLEEKVGQLLMAGYAGRQVSPGLANMIRSGHVGNVILYRRNARTTAEAGAAASALQQAAAASRLGIPLLIAVDQEGGVVTRLTEDTAPFPGNMALGAAGAPELTRRVAAAMGSELRQAGINMNLAPVVDVNTDPANPVIGVRSFGEDPDIVAAHGLAAMHGFHAAGVVATLKHFPGHGDTRVDSHLDLPLIRRTPAEQAGALRPFRQAIAAGAEAIMVAHVAIPDVDPSGAPTSLSPRVITGLLRRELGYDGVVITDGLEMRAIRDRYGMAEAGILALQAGADLLLYMESFDDLPSIHGAIVQAVVSGRLSEAGLDQSVRRVLSLKEWVRTTPAAPTPPLAEREALASEAARQAVTLFRDTAGLLPLPAGGEHVLVLAPRLPGFGGGPLALARRVAAAVERHGRTARAMALPGKLGHAQRQQVHEAAATADLVLFVSVRLELQPDHPDLLRALAAGPAPVIWLNLGSPYDLALVPTAPTSLVAYDAGQAAVAAAVDVIFGTAAPRGRLPVTVSAP